MLLLLLVVIMSADKRVLTFGKRLREVRKSKGLSQEKLAELAGIDRSYMSEIERGEYNISLLKLYQICDALEVEAKDLV